ncbi:MAG: hypothetical protein ACI81Y_002668, partial [Glaciecola sp.]
MSIPHQPTILVPINTVILDDASPNEESRINHRTISSIILHQNIEKITS